MLRNREIKIYVFFMALILITVTAVNFSLDRTAGIITFVSLLLITVTSLIFTKWRYDKIAQLSQYLKRISSGEYFLDIRDNDEGELSILKVKFIRLPLCWPNKPGC